MPAEHSAVGSGCTWTAWCMIRPDRCPLDYAAVLWCYPGTPYRLGSENIKVLYYMVYNPTWSMSSELCSCTVVLPRNSIPTRIWKHQSIILSGVRSDLIDVLWIMQLYCGVTQEFHTHSDLKTSKYYIKWCTIRLDRCPLDYAAVLWCYPGIPYQLGSENIEVSYNEL